jgi:alkylated DNA repair protein (DNA oxidative demethylase)
MNVPPLFPRQPEVVAAGAVLLPGWLGFAEQRELVEACRRWGGEAGGFRSPRMPRGGVMSVEITCLGWHWLPYRYSRRVDDGDGRPVLPFPAWLGAISRRAVQDAAAIDPGVVAGAAADGEASESYEPDVALINWYGPGAHMGMHVDRDEKCPDPVVSISLGDSCTFRFGTPAGRGRPWTDVVLESGDLFVFGGPSRLAYHGVPRVVPSSGPPDLGVGEGRFNVTVRRSGLADPR